MIVLAAIFILYAAIEEWLTGLRLDNLGSGALLVVAGRHPQRRIGVVPDPARDGARTRSSLRRTENTYSRTVGPAWASWPGWGW